ncbi:MAG: flagellar biosynthesis protein FlhB [Gammaproteobacteria bacterium]|nr:flagellar biosynthesis protein FlhB [Gammaproteobacteria bacterium]
MAEHDTSQEKTEQPTPKKLREAKQKGQIPRSKELNSMSIMVIGAAGLLMLGHFMIGSLSQMMINGFSISRAEILDPSAVFNRFGSAAWEALSGIFPFLALMTIVAIFTPLILGGWAFSFDQIALKPERLNPISGLKRIFSAKGLMELVKALAKFFVVSVVAAAFMWSQAEEFLNLGREPFLQGMGHAAWLFGYSFLVMSLSLVLIAAIDVPFQIWDHSNKLKMTLQEVRDEMKETEGRPEVKSKVRSLQQEMAQRRMMEDVPTADVIITNPTHYAVALKYDPETMDVPVVVAMGKDLIALKIREIAKQHDIEIFEAPPLARTLFAHSKIGQEIPGQLYYAVAQVLAFVFQLHQAREHGLDIPQRPDPYVPNEEEFKA